MEQNSQPQVEKYSYIDKPKKQSGAKWLNAILVVIILILVITLIVFTTTLTTITVDGKSMFPTLVDGDRLMLVKHSYTLNRGDIIVFTRESRNNVKRILGLEGDVIKFDLENMTWVVNGEAYDEEYVDGGYSENYFSMSPQGMEIFTQEGLTIPQGHVFVLGDNRNIQGGGVSMDSHIYGALDMSNIIGKVIKIF
ncbi:MAG: signal peptidase I [Clostridia bacterium]|nr:signal peptidase I [Clostridia bacterium]